MRRKAGRVLCPHGSGRAENIIMKLRLGTRPFASHSSSQTSAAGCMSGNETVRNDLSCLTVHRDIDRHRPTSPS